MSQATVELIRAEAARLTTWLLGQPGAIRLITGTVTKDEYAHFLIQTYHYIRWTTPLLRAAARRLRAQGRYPDLAALMELQAQQKDGHDQWLLSDLLALGYPESAVLSATVSPAVKAYVAWNRFTVQDGSPLALLGTAYVLGLMSVQHAFDLVRVLLDANAIQGIAGAVKFLSGHRDVDPGHVEQIEKAILKVTEPDDCDGIHDSARATRAQYAGLFVSPVAEGRAEHPERPLKLRLPPFWVSQLTLREQEVTTGVLEGADNEEVAKDLHCSEGTVKKHLQSVFDKLDVSSRAELVSRYLRYLLDEGP